jgi:hypothetical protein
MEWCEICGEYEYGSHYHCQTCWQTCSMMGHRDCNPRTEPERIPEPADKRGARFNADFQPPEVQDELRRRLGRE